RARKRDPLKLGLYLLIGVAVCFVAYYFVRLGSVHSITSERDKLAAEWAELEPKQEAAAQRAEELRGTLDVADALVEYIEGRFYWAPLLSRMGGVVPPDVQIKRIAGDRRGKSELQLTI